MTGCFVVLHTPGENKIRDACALGLRTYMSSCLSELDTPTIRITSSDDVKSFLLSTPEFKLDYKGWDTEYRGSPYIKEKARPKGWQYGPIGIWASNFYAWKVFLTTDYDYLLIFENDVKVEDNFFELFSSYINELPQDWEVFHQYVPPMPFQQRAQHKPITKNTSISYQTWSNAAYAISRKGAERMIEDVSKGIYLPLDWQWFKQRNQYKTYTVSPKSPIGCSLVDVRSTYQYTDQFVDLSFLKDEL